MCPWGLHTLRQRNDEKIPGRALFYAWTQHGIVSAETIYSDVWQWTQWAIIMGTMSEQNKTELKIGKDLCRILAVLKGWHYRSKLVDKMVNGPFCKKFKPARTRADWVTSDTEKLDQYVSDPLCSFVFTVNAYYQMFCGIQQTQKRESIYMIPKTLPIFMVSGSDDPVGGFGKGVRKIYEKYRAAGIQDVTLRLYAGDRHEILNETDREQVYQDLYEWMQSKMEV